MYNSCEHDSVVEKNSYPMPIVGLVPSSRLDSTCSVPNSWYIFSTGRYVFRTKQLRRRCHDETVRNALDRQGRRARTGDASMTSDVRTDASSSWWKTRREHRSTPRPVQWLRDISSGGIPHAEEGHPAHRSARNRMGAHFADDLWVADVPSRRLTPRSILSSSPNPACSPGTHGRAPRRCSEETRWRFHRRSSARCFGGTCENDTRDDHGDRIHRHALYFIHNVGDGIRFRQVVYGEDEHDAGHERVQYEVGVFCVVPCTNESTSPNDIAVTVCGSKYASHRPAGGRCVRSRTNRSTTSIPSTAWAEEPPCWCGPSVRAWIESRRATTTSEGHVW